MFRGLIQCAQCVAGGFGAHGRIGCSGFPQTLGAFLLVGTDEILQFGCLGVALIHRFADAELFFSIPKLSTCFLRVAGFEVAHVACGERGSFGEDSVLGLGTLKILVLRSAIAALRAIDRVHRLVGRLRGHGHRVVEVTGSFHALRRAHVGGIRFAPHGFLRLGNHLTQFALSFAELLKLFGGGILTAHHLPGLLRLLTCAIGKGLHAIGQRCSHVTELLRGKVPRLLRCVICIGRRVCEFVQRFTHRLRFMTVFAIEHFPGDLTFGGILGESLQRALRSRRQSGALGLAQGALHFARRPAPIGGSVHGERCFFRIPLLFASEVAKCFFQLIDAIGGLDLGKGVPCAGQNLRFFGIAGGVVVLRHVFQCLSGHGEFVRQQWISVLACLLHFRPVTQLACGFGKGALACRVIIAIGCALQIGGQLLN